MDISPFAEFWTISVSDAAKALTHLFSAFCFVSEFVNSETVIAVVVCILLCFMFDILLFYSHSTYLQLEHHIAIFIQVSFFYFWCFCILRMWIGFELEYKLLPFYGCRSLTIRFENGLIVCRLFSLHLIFLYVRCGWKWEEMYFVIRPNMPVITWVEFWEGAYYWCRTRMSQVLNGNYCLYFSFVSNLVRACWCISSFKFNCKFAVINIFSAFCFFYDALAFLEAIIMIDG